MTTQGNQYGPTHRFRIKPLEVRLEAPHALPARSCRCEVPWLERDEENTAHCIACGRDYRP
jgi:hypothetical protein